MIRTCDGTDPYLVRREGDDYVPCTCGKTFDDVTAMVVYPHQSLAGKANLVADLAEQFKREHEEPAGLDTPKDQG